MLSSIRIGSSTRSVVMMFWYLRLATSRSLGLLEVPAASSVDGCWAPSSQDVLSYTCCLWSKHIAMGGQMLTCVICRSGISGLDLFFTLRGWLLRSRRLGGWSSRGGLWPIPHVSYRPDAAESVMLLHKSKRTGSTLCKKRSTLTAKISS
jgi:hypothetical protein